MSPLLAADSLMLSLYFQRDFTQIALLTGYHLLGVGISGFMFVASARVWGKRHLFLLGNILMIISAVWGGASNHNYKSLVWARVFQGVALAPFEALVNACVGDLYFVHVRTPSIFGRMVMLTTSGTRKTNGCHQRSTIWKLLLDTGCCRQDRARHWVAMDFLLCRHLFWRVLTPSHIFRARDSISTGRVSQH